MKNRNTLTMITGLAFSASLLAAGPVAAPRVRETAKPREGGVRIEERGKEGVRIEGKEGTTTRTQQYKKGATEESLKKPAERESIDGYKGASSAPKSGEHSPSTGSGKSQGPRSQELGKDPTFKPRAKSEKVKVENFAELAAKIDKISGDKGIRDAVKKLKAETPAEEAKAQEFADKLPEIEKLISELSGKSSEDASFLLKALIEQEGANLDFEKLKTELKDIPKDKAGTFWAVQAHIEAAERSIKDALSKMGMKEPQLSEKASELLDAWFKKDYSKLEANEKSILEALDKAESENSLKDFGEQVQLDRPVKDETLAGLCKNGCFRFLGARTCKVHGG